MRHMISSRAAGAGRRGFTLIELLTVIAIIAVLAAILFPVFSKARENGRKATCMNNLQQLGIAISLYEGDYGGFLPSWSISHPTYTPPAVKDQPDPSVITWDISVGAYIKDNRILVCRSNPNTNGNTARAYTVAQYTQRFRNGTTPFIGIYKDSVPAPSKTIMLFEKGANPPGSWGDALGQNVNQTWNSADQAPSYSDKPFHNGGKNFLYLDGHVKWFTKTAGPFGEKSTRTGAEPGDVAYPGVQKADGTGGDWPEAD